VARLLAPAGWRACWASLSIGASFCPACGATRVPSGGRSFFWIHEAAELYDLRTGPGLVGALGLLRGSPVDSMALSFLPSFLRLGDACRDIRSGGLVSPREQIEPIVELAEVVRDDAGLGEVRASARLLCCADAKISRARDGDDRDARISFNPFLPPDLGRRPGVSTVPFRKPRSMRCVRAQPLTTTGPARMCAPCFSEARARLRDRQQRLV